MSRRALAQAAGLFAGGALIGGVVAGTVGASAATRAAAPSPAPYGGYAAAGSDRHHGPGPGMRPFAPMQSGTVTAVGSSSVTIKTTSGTKTYAVDADSDIDKNGEAKLSDLVAGDAVHFAVRPNTSTIAVLHAGDEAKNMPPGRHGGMRGHCDGDGPHGDGPGGVAPGRPAPSPSASSSSST